MYLQQNWWFLFHCGVVCLTGCYAIDPGCDSLPEARTEGYRLEGDLLESLSPVGYQQCRARCRARHACLSINYNRQQLMCELVRTATSELDQLTVAPGYSFTNLNASDVIPPQEMCQKDSCPEQHICIILTSTGNLTCVEDFNAVQTTTTTTTTTTTPTPTTTTTTPTTTTISGSRRNGCVSGDFTFEASVDLCYRLTTSTFLYWFSEITCENYANGRLVILDSAEKKQFMYSLISSSTYSAYSKWWIDGSKPDNDSPFTWSTGAAVSPQPTSGGDDRLKMVMRDDGGFFDESTSSLLPFICEEYSG